MNQLRSLERQCDALEQVPESAALSDLVVMRVQQALRLTRPLLSRLCVNMRPHLMLFLIELVQLSGLRASMLAETVSQALSCPIP